MLISIDACIGYVKLSSCGLMAYFVNWKVGLIILIICAIGYAFWLNYRCCGVNGTNHIQNNYNLNPNNRNRNNENQNKRRGIMGVDDLPKTQRSG